MSELAGWRDASWWRSNGVAHVYHVSLDGFAACNRGMLLIEDQLFEAALVPPAVRCRRSGCKTRWPHTPRGQAS